MVPVLRYSRSRSFILTATLSSAAWLTQADIIVAAHSAAAIQYRISSPDLASRCL
jgi:hypothetical protein